MKPASSLLDRIAHLPAAAEIIAALGALAYFLQSSRLIHQLPSTLDEGNYVYKGFLFLTGAYWPYQAYGPWTNKMPLAFLIPGSMQVLFEPGIRTARYFAIFLGLLMLLGLWLAARRLSNRWWAAALIWTIALNPGVTGMYSQAISEGIVACQLAWVCALILGEKRPLWQTTLGAALAGLIVVTRENMLPVVLFAVGYIFWQHGAKAGWYALAACVLALGAVHAIFWPNILQIWASLAPARLTPFLDPWRNLAGGTAIWKPDVGWISRIYVFWESFRYHFVALFGSITVWVLWPRRSAWQSEAKFRTAVALSALLVVLTLAHLWASMGMNYCLYCYSLYLSFFSELGLLLVAVSLGSLQRRLGWLRSVLAGAVVVLWSGGIAFGAHQDLAEPLLTLTVPRIRDMQIQAGSTELWRLLSNKFQVEYELLKQIIPPLFGLLVGVLFVLLVWGGCRLALRRRSALSGGYAALVVFLLLGTLLTPTTLMGDANRVECGGDVIASYETAAAHLRQVLPAGAQIDWRGGLSTVPLLYLPDVKIYPAQLNDGYSRRIGGNTDLLLRRGLWNDELYRKWLKEADYILVEERMYKSDLKAAIESLDRVELERTPPIAACYAASSIRIFGRKQ